MNPNRETVECGLCTQKTAIKIVAVVTIPGTLKRRAIEVTRCGICDTTPCPNCDNRTLKVNAVNCADCGTPLLPRPSK